MKRLVSIFLAAMLAFSTVIVTTEPVKASTADWEFTGATCTSNASAASTINYIRAKHDQYSQYKGSGQCFGWAEKVGNMLAAERSYKEYKSLRFNKKNFKAKCLNVKAGTHLRLSHEKKYNPWSGHSICLLKVTNNQVCWTDNNYAGYETIAYYSATLDQFVNYYSQYEYLNMITKTTKYKSQSEPLLAIEKAADGRSKLYWPKTTSTSKYKVYRATSKNGTYKLIKTTTAKNYKDTTAKYGTKYYYKVKSVKSGEDLYSNTSYSTARLIQPVITEHGNHEESGKIWIKWNKVKGADKYSIYRSKNGGKYKYFASTKETTYIDPNAADPTKYFSYKVKAIYNKNAKGNSYVSEPTYALHTRLAAPKVNYTFDEVNKQLILTWEEVPYAKNYLLGSYENQNYGWYTQVAYTEDLTYTVDLNRYYAGNTYEFWVQAIPDSGYASPISQYVTIAIPDDWTHDDYWYWY